MQPPDLLTWIRDRSAHPSLWQIDDESLDVHAVLDWSRSAIDWRNSFEGKQVAIAGGSNRFLMLAMVLLDGAADAILPLPAGLPPDVVNDFVLKTEIRDVVIENENDAVLLNAFPFRHVLPGSSPISVNKVAPGRARITRQSRPTRWLIPTSGTTGTPKLVAHTLQSLTRTTKRDLSRGAELRWGLLYDLTRFAGLQVYLQALAGGSLLLLPPAGASVPQQIAFLARNGCNALSATPTVWRKFLMNPGVDTLPLSHITLGGEIADNQILTSLVKKFPLAVVRHIYASTEAGVGFAVSDGRSGFPSTFLQEPPPGLCLMIRELDGMLLMRPAGKNPSHYVAENMRIQDEEGWIETGDLVSIVHDRVHFLGRASGAINVGGAKVHPGEVEVCLRELPWVVDAMVRGKRNPFSGNVVEAIIVTSTELPANLTAAECTAAARNHCRGKLEAYKVPAIVHVRDSLPTTTTGKLIRE
jgi:acyl-CoA synthetase (AMP-forming)/AMP-acid ligase II